MRLCKGTERDKREETKREREKEAEGQGMASSLFSFFFFLRLRRPPPLSNLFSLSFSLSQNKKPQEVPASAVTRDWIEGLDSPAVVRRKGGESVEAAAALIGLALPKFDDDNDGDFPLSRRQRRRRRNWFLPKNLASLLGDPSNSSFPRFRALDPQGNECQTKWCLGEQWVSYSMARGGAVASAGNGARGDGGGVGAPRRGGSTPETTAALAGAATPAATAALAAAAAVAAPAAQNGAGGGGHERAEEEEDEEADEADSTRIVRPALAGAAKAVAAALPLSKKPAAPPPPPHFSSKGISLESKRRLLVAEVRLCGDGDGDGDGGGSSSALSPASRAPAAVAAADLVAELLRLEPASEAAALIQGISPARSRLSVHPAGGFSDWKLPAAGAAGWRFALGGGGGGGEGGGGERAKNVPRVVFAAPLSAANAATFAAWARGAPLGAVALVKSLEGVVRAELRAGDAVFLPPGWLVSEATPSRAAAVRSSDYGGDEPDDGDGDGDGEKEEGDDEDDDEDDEGDEDDGEGDDEASSSLFGGSACLAGQALLCSGWRQHAAASRLEDALGAKPRDRRPGLERLAWVSAKCWGRSLRAALPSAAKRAALGLAVAALTARRRQARQEEEAAAAAARAEAEAEAAARVLAGSLGGEVDGAGDGGGAVPWAEEEDERNQQQQRPKTGLKVKLRGLSKGGGGTEGAAAAAAVVAAAAAAAVESDSGGGGNAAAAGAASSPKVSVRLKLPSKPAAAAAAPAAATGENGGASGGGSDAVADAAAAAAAAPPAARPVLSAVAPSPARPLAALRPSIVSAVPHLARLLREWSLLPPDVLAAASSGHADPLAAADALAEGIRAVASAAASAAAASAAAKPVASAAETAAAAAGPDPSSLSLLFSSPAAAAEAVALAALPPPVVLPAAFDADEAAPILPFRWGEEGEDEEGERNGGDDDEFRAFGTNFEEEAGDSFDGFDGVKRRRKRSSSGPQRKRPSKQQQAQQQQRPRSAVGETAAPTAAAAARGTASTMILSRKQFPSSPKLASKSVKDRLKKKLKLR